MDIASRVRGSDTLDTLGSLDAQAALAHAREIRNRYTFLDFAADLAG